MLGLVISGKSFKIDVKSQSGSFAEIDKMVSGHCVIATFRERPVASSVMHRSLRLTEMLK